MRVAFLVIVFTLGISSQTLTQAVKKGIDSDPRMKVLLHEYHMAIKDVELVEAGFEPSVDITGGIYEERTKTPASLDGKFKTMGSGDFTISGKYNLFSGYKKKYMLKEKDAAILLAKNKLREGAIVISQEIAMAYIEMLKQYKVYRAYQRNIDNYRRTLNKVSLKIKDGGGKDSDLLQIRSRMDYEKANLLAAKQVYQDAKIVLARYLKNVPKINHMYDPKINRKYLNLRQLISKATKHNSTLRSLGFQREMAYALVGQAKSKFYPTVDLASSYSWSKNRSGIVGVDQNYKVGINAKYKLYNGGADALSVEKAQLQTLRTSDAMRDAKQSIILSIKRIYSNYKIYGEKLNAINRHIADAQKTEKLYIKEEEETGERSIIDILNIRQESNAAKIERINTIYTMKQLYFQMLANTSDILNYFHLSKYSK